MLSPAAVIEDLIRTTSTQPELLLLGEYAHGRLAIDDSHVEETLDNKYQETYFEALYAAPISAYVGDVVHNVALDLQNCK